MIGPEREEMLQVIDDDDRLDKFLVALDEERKHEMANARGKKKPKVSKDEYISKHAKVYDSFG